MQITLDTKPFAALETDALVSYVFEDADPVQGLAAHGALVVAVEQLPSIKQRDRLEAILTWNFSDTCLDCALHCIAVAHWFVAIRTTINALSHDFDMLLFEMVGDDLEEQRFVIVADAFGVEDFQCAAPVACAVELKAADARAFLKEKRTPQDKEQSLGVR